jgi:MoaA/NifB/PqqE/SkfB family radical SAM enzyme
MAYDLFARILDKILREAPVSRPVIALYNWGEPLLHPEIGRIVRRVRGHNLYCAVSTNLNQARFLEDLVSAHPNTLRISLSGFSQHVYGRTHTRGRIETVKTNMRTLREMIDRHQSRIDVRIAYHRYIGNGGEEWRSMQALARELGFTLQPKIARMYPLEKALALGATDAEPQPGDRALFDLLLVKPSEWFSVAGRGGEMDTSCTMLEQEMAINFDGSVALCCNVYDYANNVSGDFLASSHEDLQASKRDHHLCGTCMASNYPRSCGLDEHADIQAIVEARASVPGA